MKKSLLFIVVWFVSNKSADIQKAFDFKTFDPVSYFKRDLPSVGTNQPKKIEVEKYCDRLHQFITLLLYQEHLVNLFCGIIPAIGPSEKYEQYKFINGLIVELATPKQALVDFNENFAKREVIDAYEIEAFPKPGVMGVRLLESMPAISLALSMGKLDMIRSVDKIERLFPILQRIFSNPENDEVKKLAGSFIHSYYFARIPRLLGSVPIILEAWSSVEIGKAEKIQPLTIESPESYLKQLFPDVSFIIPHIPLFSDFLVMYAKLDQAYANSGSIEATSGKITTEFKDVKSKLGVLLDKMQKYTGLISKKYEIAKRSLTENRKWFKDQHQKYVMYGLEYLPPQSLIPLREIKLIVSSPTTRTYHLKNELNFDCIAERNKPKKKVIQAPQKTTEKLKNEPAYEFSQQHTTELPSSAALVVKDIAQKNHELKAEESKISYDQRILNWLNPEFVQGKDPHSVLYHTFSFLIDPIIKKYGKQSEFVAKDHKNHPTYHLAGEVTYLAGPKQNKKELYVFVNTYDPKGILYHRGIESVKQGENFFQDFFSKSYMNIKDQPVSLESGVAPAVGQDALLSENEYSILVHDGRNNVNITLLKPLEELSYN